MSKLKRGYLNDGEENFLMMSNCLIEMMEGNRSKDNTLHDPIWEEWVERGMMTPSMKRSIKTAHTYLLKFQEELYENLDNSMKSKIDKKIAKYDCVLLDDYTTKRLFKDMDDRIKHVTLDRNTFEDILVDMCGVTCVGCKRDYKECEICRALEESMLPYLGVETNCPYAVDLSQYTPEEKEHYDELLKKLEQNNQFFRR